MAARPISAFRRQAYQLLADQYYNRFSSFFLNRAKESVDRAIGDLKSSGWNMGEREQAIRTVAETHLQARIQKQFTAQVVALHDEWSRRTFISSEALLRSIQEGEIKPSWRMDLAPETDPEKGMAIACASLGRCEEQKEILWSLKKKMTARSITGYESLSMLLAHHPQEEHIEPGSLHLVGCFDMPDQEAITEAVLELAKNLEESSSRGILSRLKNACRSRWL